MREIFFAKVAQVEEKMEEDANMDVDLQMIQMVQDGPSSELTAQTLQQRMIHNQAIASARRSQTAAARKAVVNISSLRKKT